MGIDLGGLAGGFMGGMEEGADLKEKYHKAAAQAMARKADANYSQMLQQAASGTVGGGQPKPPAGPGMPSPSVAPKPPMPGGPPPGPPPGPPQGGMQPPPGGPTPVPMPGARPMVPPPQAGPAQSPMGPKPPMPAPAAPPSAAAAPPPGGGGGGGQPKPPGGDMANDPVMQSKAMFQSIAQEVLNAFPGKKWKPSELLDTVDSVLQHTSAIDPIAKQMAQLQLQYYKSNLQAQTSSSNTNKRVDASEHNTDERVGATERGQDLSHEDRQSAIKASLQKQDLADATRLQAEDIIQTGANGRAALVAQSKDDALQAGLDEKEWATQLQAHLKEQGLSDAFTSKLFSAEQGASTSPLAPPKRGVPKPLATPPSRRNAAAPTAPYPGAKKAPDGNWYVEDPKRPGKYLKVG